MSALQQRNTIDDKSSDKGDVIVTHTSDLDVETLPHDQIKSETAAQAAENNAATADYSGFSQKTDPAEIRLVRKMDVYIMLSLWSMVSSLCDTRQCYVRAC